MLIESCQNIISVTIHNKVCESSCKNLIPTSSQNILRRSGCRNLISSISPNIFCGSGCHDLISSIPPNIFCQSSCHDLISPIPQNIFYQSGYRNLISPSSQNIFYQSGCKSLISQHRHNKIAKHAAFTQHPEPRTTPEREAESTDSTLAAAQAPRAAGQPLTQRHGKPSAASAAREYTLLAAFPAREQYDPSLCAALRHITQPGAPH